MGKKGLICLFLLAGCAQPESQYCDLSTTMYFDTNAVVDYLAQNDENLLKEIVINNETRARLCN